MTHTKDLIDFIYQNILLFHFKALSLCTLNERLKDILVPLISSLIAFSHNCFTAF